MIGDEAGVYRMTPILNGAYTVDAGLAALARQMIYRKAADDAAHIISMLNIQED